IGNQALQTYLIAKDGSIEFPQLGKLYVAGLSRLEAIAMLKEKLIPYLVDPVVNIQLLNFKVTILGEVKKPGSYTVQNERITVLEALGLAGDLSIFGERHNVLLIRETEKGKEYKRIDLTSRDFFDSAYYYLQQNDVIYVEPNKPRINSSANSSTTGVLISITSILITIATLVIRS
ncbi:MAG: polysaccharide biosynthesis/export family protein, partial [Flavicella sp.]